MKIRWHGEAIEEAKAAASYYNEIQPRLAQRFLDELEDTLHRIQRYPHVYRLVEGEIRKCRIAHFPYGIIFRERPDAIEIIAVMHLRRSPGYWKHRS